MAGRILSLLLFAAALVSGARAVKVLGALDQLSAEEQQKAKDLVTAYDRVEGYLQSIDSDESDTLINGTKAIYAKKHLNPLSKLKQDSSRLLEAMRLFTSLPKALDSCDYKSYKILAMNHLASDVDLFPSPRSPRKSAKVMRDIAKRHALLCRPKYEENFQKLYQQSDDQVSAAFFAVQLLFSDLERDETCIAQSFGHSGSKPDPNKKCLKQIAERLLIASEKERIEKMTIDRLLAITRKFNKTIDEHLLRPCRAYRAYFKDVFAPAIYDATLGNEQQETFLHPKKGDFDAGFRFYRACEFVLKDERLILRLLLNEVSDLYQIPKH